MNFSNTKLSVGILYVGFIVVVSTLCLYFDLPNLLIRGFGDNIYTVFIYILLLIIATLPLDILSSYKLNSFKNRNVYKIILGNLILFLLLSLFAFIIFITYEQRNILLAFTALLFAQLALIHIQELSVKNFFNFRFESFEDLSLIIIPNAPKYMTMNIIRPYFKPYIVVPQHWTETNDRNYKFHIQRFKVNINQNSNTKSMVLSIMINSTLFACLYYYLTDPNISPAYFSIQISLIFNLISFLYILVLPNLSQKGIYKIDKIMKNKNINLFKENLLIFEKNQDKNNFRSNILEKVFYPIPSINTRLNSNIKGGFGFPNLSRIIIFLATSNLSIIMKGVHGNAGKVENWLLPPSE